MPALPSYRDHVLQLARENHVFLTWVPRRDLAESFPSLGHARVPEIESGYDYLVALHEIGHCAFPGHMEAEHDDSKYGRLARESLAWSWAAAIAYPVPPATWPAILNRYLVGYFIEAASGSTRDLLDAFLESQELPSESVSHCTETAPCEEGPA